MPTGVRVVDRIQDQADYAGTPAVSDTLVYNGTDFVPTAPDEMPAPGLNCQMLYNAFGTFGAAQAVTYSPRGNILTVASQGATDVPLTVKGATGQTGNILNFTDSSNASVVQLQSSGVSSGPALRLYGRSALDRGIEINSGGGGNQADITILGGTARLTITVGSAIFCVGTAVSSGLACNGSGLFWGKSNSVLFTISCDTPTSDQAPWPIAVKAGTALTSASSNQNGAYIAIVGGDGSATAGKTGVGGHAYICGGAKSPSGTDGDVWLNYDGIAAAARGNLRVCRGVTTGLTTLGTVIGKWEIFDAAGASIGFLPIYDAIT